MARKGYPFSNRDVRYGSNRISSLFAIPFSVGVSSLLSSSKNVNNYDIPFTYEQFNGKYLELKYLINGFCALLCPLAGLISYAYFDWWMFFSILVFGLVGLLFTMPSSTFVMKIRTYYIFHENYNEESRQCKSILKLTIFFNGIYFLLSTYPFITLLFPLFCGIDYPTNHLVFFVWDGGELPFLMILFAILMSILSFMPMHDTYNAYKHFDEYIVENPSIKKIMK